MDILELNNSLIPHYMDFRITAYYMHMYTPFSVVLFIFCNLIGVVR